MRASVLKNIRRLARDLAAGKPSLQYTIVKRDRPGGGVTRSLVLGDCERKVVQRLKKLYRQGRLKFHEKE